MAKQAETSFKEKVYADVREYDECWIQKIQQRVIRGTPDMLLCLRGNFVALELKDEGEDADPLQEYTLNAIRKAGGTALTVQPSDWPGIWKGFIRRFSLRRKVLRASPL